MFRKSFDLGKYARLYEKNGVDAVSVLTDRHFKGKLADLGKVKKALHIPVLRKDFIIDEYQVYESYLADADAVLLIAANLSAKKLEALLDLTHRLKMQALIEVHSAADVKKINMRKARIIGINNRDLDDFTVDIDTTRRIGRLLPAGKTIVSESGIRERREIVSLKKCGVNAVLVGEGIVSSVDIAAKIRSLAGKRK